LAIFISSFLPGKLDASDCPECGSRTRFDTCNKRTKLAELAGRLLY